MDINLIDDLLWFWPWQLRVLMWTCSECRYLSMFFNRFVELKFQNKKYHFFEKLKQYEKPFYVFYSGRQYYQTSIHLWGMRTASILSFRDWIFKHIELVDNRFLICKECICRSFFKQLTFFSIVVLFDWILALFVLRSETSK